MSLHPATRRTGTSTNFFQVRPWHHRRNNLFIYFRWGISPRRWEMCLSSPLGGACSCEQCIRTLPPALNTMSSIVSPWHLPDYTVLLRSVCVCVTVLGLPLGVPSRDEGTYCTQLPICLFRLIFSAWWLPHLYLSHLNFGDAVIVPLAAGDGRCSSFYLLQPATGRQAHTFSLYGIDCGFGVQLFIVIST